VRHLQDQLPRANFRDHKKGGVAIPVPSIRCRRRRSGRWRENLSQKKRGGDLPLSPRAPQTPPDPFLRRPEMVQNCYIEKKKGREVGVGNCEKLNDAEKGAKKKLSLWMSVASLVQKATVEGDSDNRPEFTAQSRKKRIMTAVGKEILSWGGNLAYYHLRKRIREQMSTSGRRKKEGIVFRIGGERKIRKART